MKRRTALALGLAMVFGLGAGACGETDTKLKVTNIEPRDGDMNGGSFITITGNRFLDDGPRNVKVFFGNRQGTVVRFLDDRTLIVQAPGGKPDETVDVLILFEPGGKLKIENGYTYRDQSNDKLELDQLDTSKVTK